MRTSSALAILAVASIVASLSQPAPLRAQSASGDSTKAPPPPPPVVDSAPAPPPAAAVPAALPPLPDKWKLKAGLSASVLYGNREQRILGARWDLSRADSAVELRADMQTSYGEASTETEARQVFKRIWLGNLSADLQPYAPVSPFVFVTLESNLEKRIQGRYSAGAGAKQTLLRTERSEASLSAGLLGEQLVPRADAAGVVNDRALTRWSFRGKLRHMIGDRTRILHTTFWRPDVHRASEYLVQSQTDMEFKATNQLALTLSLMHNYDTEATGRGARTNTDGQMLVGATATW